MENNFAFDLESIQYPCEFYIADKRIAIVKNITGLKQIINIMLLKGANKKDIAIKEFDYVEFEEINDTLINI